MPARAKTNIEMRLQEKIMGRTQQAAERRPGIIGALHALMRSGLDPRRVCLLSSGGRDEQRFPAND
jgi:hypothetical protein